MALTVDVRRAICESRIDELLRQEYNYRLDMALATAAGDTDTVKRIDDYLLTVGDKVYALEAELRSLDAEAAAAEVQA